MCPWESSGGGGARGSNDGPFCPGTPPGTRGAPSPSPPLRRRCGGGPGGRGAGAPRLGPRGNEGLGAGGALGRGRAREGPRNLPRQLRPLRQPLAREALLVLAVLAFLVARLGQLPLLLQLLPGLALLLLARVGLGELL